MNRRNFIKAASSGALLLGAAPSISHAAAENRPPIPGSLGMLYDSTLCVGCQACVTKCQDINFPARNPEGEQTWSNNDKLSPYTNNIIQVWRSGTGVNKDQEEMATHTSRNSACTVLIRTAFPFARSPR